MAPYAVLANAYCEGTQPFVESSAFGRTVMQLPRSSFERSLVRYADVQRRETLMPIHERCRSALLDHGRRTENAAVYFHGFTSCPAQGAALASRLHRVGFNVYLPRMFGHGGSDPTTMSMEGLDLRKLVDMADESVDIATGLGANVFVIGLSAGGTIASWVAQNRSEVFKTICISPFFAPFMVPANAVQRASSILLGLPNAVLAWNPLSKPIPERVDYPFARPATHALAQIMLLGQEVRKSALDGPPAAAGIAVLLNEADRSVSNRATQELVAAWKKQGADVAVETIALRHRLPHDLVNPFEKGNDFEHVYAVLSEMLAVRGI